MDVLHEAPKIGAPWCAYAVTLPEASASPDRVAETARTLGFGAVLLLGASPDDPAWEAACDAKPLTDLARAAHAQGISLYATLCLGEVASHHQLAGSAFSEAACQPSTQPRDWSAAMSHQLPKPAYTVPLESSSAARWRVTAGLNA